MPRKAIDYTKTHFYKIVCKDTTITDCYVGHTTDFTKRKYQHKTACNNENAKGYNIYLYQFMRENCGFNNWEMVSINTHECCDAFEARKIEREYVEELKASLNKHIPSRTKKQYAEDTKEHIQEYQKEYCSNHKEEKKEYDKIYRENNKDRKRENDRLYRENNKDYLKIQKGLKFECECGGRYTNCHKQEHIRSNKHQNYLKTLEPVD